MDTGIVIGEMKPEVYITAAGCWVKYHRRRSFFPNKKQQTYINGM